MMTERRSFLHIVAAAALFGLTGCAVSPQPVVLHGEGLGSTWSVKLPDTAPVEVATLQREIQTRVDEVARNLSRWDSSSSISKINATDGEEWQSVSPVLSAPLSYALHLAEDTGGAYDPTVAPLVDAWGFGTAGRRYEPPAADALDAARARVGYARITLDADTHRVRKPSGMQLDLSSMTHGFAADRIAEYLNGAGVRSYLVDVGSEIRASGDSPERNPWHVAIEQPPAELTGASENPEAFTKVVSLRNAGIATSGNYRYFFDYNGRRYSHRIDPRNGEPVAHDLASVTVIDPECMRADALATALTVLGPDEGMKYATNRGIAALFILRAGDGLVERMTPAFAKYLN